MTAIRELDLRETNVSDKGLEYLTGLKLEWLGLSGKNLTSAGIARFSAAMPKCRIERK